ncbi:MAG TPA: sulfate ABC transporter substrate-binding protein [Micropepsaceae bacterium]|nr:sulfate ABC transporter substrate-binding protein [Micropepsaceae bacterium]
MRRHLVRLAAGVVALTSVVIAPSMAEAKTIQLLNVSYDPTRELYKQINAAFAAEWKNKTGDDVVIAQSHGGSGAQARAVIDGLSADVVTLAIAADIDAIAGKGKLLPADWQKRLPQNSTPYSSTIVFLVRKGNPKHVTDWGDLIKPGVQVITPNPKVSGGARLAYLGAWTYATHLPGTDENKAKGFMKALYQHVPVLDTGARAATLTFAQRGIGDVLLAWEDEAYLAKTQFGGNFDVVYPTASILAEPPVAMVDRNVDKHGTRSVAGAYLQYLYSKPAQEIAAKNHYRPRDPEVAARFAQHFPQIKLYTVNEDLGGWQKVQATHFADGGIFDSIVARK